VQGRSLNGVLAGSANAVRDLFYSTTLNDCGQSAMICDGAWKYVYSEANATEELYDQVRDPAEVHNRAADPAQRARVADLRRRLIACAREFADGELLEGDGLKAKAVDRTGFPQLPVRGMGWRWY